MDPARRKPTVAIIGAGAGGIAMGIKLKRAGYDFTIYEKSDGVGGTWRDNSYPGAACDVPSHLYSFSFELNPWWSRTYATQPEILAYLERCTDQYGIRPHVRTGVAIGEARWSEGVQQWELTTADGESFNADVVVSALGMLNVPVVPDIPGAERFQGRTFHSSRWDHGKSVAGERVASIGTGASAIQYVPAIATEVEHLTVFQRTPIWITPRLDKPFTPEEQRRFARVPGAARLAPLEDLVGLRARRLPGDVGADHHANGARALVPRTQDRRPRAARAAHSRLSGGLQTAADLPRLAPGVDARERSPRHRRDRGDHRAGHPDKRRRGAHRRHDHLRNGLSRNEYLTAVDFYGRDGRRLRDDWRGGAEAFLGLTVSGYPNLFMLYGPNTNGVNSIIFMHEAQANYVMSALRTLRRRRVSSLDVRPRVMDRYNRRIQRAMTGTVWTAGCRTYFIGPNGKVVTQLPYSGGRYWLRTRFLRSWQYRKTRG